MKPPFSYGFPMDFPVIPMLVSSSLGLSDTSPAPGAALLWSGRWLFLSQMGRRMSDEELGVSSAFHMQKTMENWWVLWNMTVIFPYIGNVVIPIDFHMFQRGSNHQPENHEFTRKAWSITIFQGKTLVKIIQFLMGKPAKLTWFSLESSRTFDWAMASSSPCNSH